MQCELKLELIPRVHVVGIQLKLHVTTASCHSELGEVAVLAQKGVTVCYTSVMKTSARGSTDIVRHYVMFQLSPSPRGTIQKQSYQCQTCILGGCPFIFNSRENSSRMGHRFTNIYSLTMTIGLDAVSIFLQFNTLRGPYTTEQVNNARRNVGYILTDYKAICCYHICRQ